MTRATPLSIDAAEDDMRWIHTGNERNRVRTANRYLKRIKYGNRRPNRDLADWQPPAGLTPRRRVAFEVVFDYGEHDSTIHHCRRRSWTSTCSQAGRSPRSLLLLPQPASRCALTASASGC